MGLIENHASMVIKQNFHVQVSKNEYHYEKVEQGTLKVFTTLYR